VKCFYLVHFIFVVFSTTLFQETFIFEPLFLGARAVGLGGGFSAFPADGTAILYNPAALTAVGNHELHISTGTADEDLAVGAVAGFMNNNQVGILYFRHNQNPQSEEGLILNFATPYHPQWRFGINVHYLMFDKNYLSDLLDLDLGFFWKPLPPIQTSLALQHLLGAGVDSLDAQIDRHLTWDVFYCPPLFKKRVNFGFGVQKLHNRSLDQFLEPNFRMGGGLEIFFFQKRNLGFRSGVSYQKRSGQTQTQVSAGFSAKIFKRFHKYALDYALQVDADQTSSLNHYVTLSYGLGSEVDRTPPEVDLAADSSFSPNGDGEMDHLYFKLHCQDDEGGSGLAAWSLIICQKKDSVRVNIVKSFSGGNVPPAVIEWNGQDAYDNHLAPGEYFCRLLAEDKNRNPAVSPWYRVVIKK